jgi:membrane-associated protease RseP (regulator of RpoE activity)
MSSTEVPAAVFEPEPVTGWWRLAVLLAVVAGATALAIGFGYLDVEIVIVSLILMVMLHELGHFVTAKLSGMKVTEYFLGFGPRLWSIRVGDTTYGIKAIPAGGYVRILGMNNLENVNPAEESLTYRAQSFPRRLAVGLAGSFMHFLMAFVLLWALFALVGTQTYRTFSVAGFTAFSGAPSPARLAGLRPGDVFVAVDGHRVTDPEQVISAIEAGAGKSVPVTVDRSGRLVHLVVRPDARADVTEAGLGPPSPAQAHQGVIGVRLDPASPAQVTEGPIASIGTAASQLYHLTGATLSDLARRLSPNALAGYLAHVVGSPSRSSSPTTSGATASSGRLTSIYGAGRVATQAIQAGIGDFLLVLISLNIFIGLFNLVPLPPLDGGHVIVAIYERIRSRRGRRHQADMAKLLPATYAVLAILILVGLTTFYQDVVHPLPNPFR